MFEFKQIKLSFFLILVLRSTVSSTATKPHSVFVREGEVVLLSCGNVTDQVKCDKSTWSFSRYVRSAAESLVKLGTIQRSLTSADKTNRMTLTANCSLMIQRASDEDVGRYFCQQFNYSQRDQVDLSVVKITEHKAAENVTLTCSISTYNQNRLELKWLLNGAKIDPHNKELETQSSHRSANLTFLMTHFIYQSNYKTLKCEVGGAEQQFTFRSKTSDLTITGKEDETSENTEATPVLSGLWWLYVTVAVGLAAISAAVVLLVRWRKNKGKKGTQMNETMRNNSSMSPDTGQNIEDPEVSMAYASIVHIGETNHQVRRTHAAVTYSTVKAGPSTDPSNLYDTIN